jgi:hypothetical protein
MFLKSDENSPPLCPVRGRAAARDTPGETGTGPGVIKYLFITQPSFLILTGHDQRSRPAIKIEANLFSQEYIKKKIAHKKTGNRFFSAPRLFRRTENNFVF